MEAGESHAPISSRLPRIMSLSAISPLVTAGNLDNRQGTRKKKDDSGVRRVQAGSVPFRDPPAGIKGRQRGGIRVLLMGRYATVRCDVATALWPAASGKVGGDAPPGAAGWGVSRCPGHWDGGGKGGSGLAVSMGSWDGSRRDRTVGKRRAGREAG